MIVRLVKMTFRANETSNFEQLFTKVQPLISGFEGCLGVELLKGTTSENKACVYFTRSLWMEEKNLEAYRASGLFAETWNATKAMFAEKAEAWSTKIVSNEI
ncbi:MAG: antibiotic biosynthesis monooxygenase [Flavobacteriales bacterium]|nr:antibiotic biosynthesis monooxygenase [Flavobacteriales bacterium]